MNIGVLVDHHAACNAENVAHRPVKLLCAFQPPLFCQRLRLFQRTPPLKGRNGCRVRVFKRRQLRLRTGRTLPCDHAAARLSNASDKARQRHNTAVGLLAVQRSLRTESRQDTGIARLCIFDGKAFNRLRRHAGDLFRPFRRFGDPILCAVQVGEIALSGRNAVRQMLFIKTDTETVDKFLIIQLPFADHIAHCVRKRTVGRWPDRNPLIRRRKRRIALTRIDDNDPRAQLLCLHQDALLCAAEMGGSRVMSPEDEHLGVQDFHLVVRDNCRTEHAGKRRNRTACAISAVIAKVSAVLRKKTLH